MAQPQILFPDDRRRVGLLEFGCNSGLAADDALTPKEILKGIPRDGSNTPGCARYQAQGVTVLSRLIQNSHLSPEANDAAVDSAAAQANVRTDRGVCMSWEDDRDTLIAQTMEFVQSVVNRRQGRAETAARPALLPAVEALHLNAAPAETSVFAPVRMAEFPATAAIPAPAPRPVVRGEMASEIRARIAGFRANQERFNREREEYFSATLARLKATLNDRSSLRSEK